MMRTSDPIHIDHPDLRAFADQAVWVVKLEEAVQLPNRELAGMRYVSAGSCLTRLQMVRCLRRDTKLVGNPPLSLTPGPRRNLCSLFTGSLRSFGDRGHNVFTNGMSGREQRDRHTIWEPGPQSLAPYIKTC